MYKLSKYHEFEDISESEKLLFSTRTSNLLHISHDVFEHVQKGNFDQINEKVLFKLLSSEILVPEDEDEFSVIIENFKQKTSQKGKILNYTIQPTANCQLGCHYCGQVHEKINMDQNIVDQTFDYLSNILLNGEYEGLFITWYGAEPLLGIKGIRALSEKIIKFCDDNNIKYTAMMITNGLALKERIFEELVNLRIVKYQITLDGDEDSHDLSRYTKKKEKTFKIILNNIIQAAKNPIYDEKDCVILIRCNIHKDNYQSIDSLIDMLYETGISEKLTLDFAPVHDWGKNYAKDNLGLTPTFFGELEIEWYLKMKEYNFKFVKDVLPQKRAGTCMVTNKESELIDAKGRLSYCWETPYTPEFDNDESQLFHGDIFNPSDKKDRNDLPLGNWYEDIENENYGTTCRKCKFLPVCGGGCPIHWYKEMAMCPSFKYNFKDRMVLQYVMSKEYFGEAAV
ncbi:radical SAM/SPASM domain-containing protein [Chryseobacterium sediminis]|jgi:uncharacterized protein|uniref:radical SAM/SPASM domain-containing protein n=1 Tax=Chryseobacterium sediminis TaxID=1679494 RepID=UPI002861249C|nr:radical SAM protein [Chryseobacterium sediminis]MDR6464769.1 uncharacterized protein [Chryseobacterium sediminis]